MAAASLAPPPLHPLPRTPSLAFVEPVLRLKPVPFFSLFGFNLVDFLAFVVYYLFSTDWVDFLPTTGLESPLLIGVLLPLIWSRYITY